MNDDAAADMAAAIDEFSQQLAGEILSNPELSDPDWDTFAMVVEVSDGRLATTAYRYGASGRPVPTRRPAGLGQFRELRDRTRGDDGQGWDVVIVKIHRDTAVLVLDFVAGPDADVLRVHPDNLAELPERLRPGSEDFGLDPEAAIAPGPATPEPTEPVTAAARDAGADPVTARSEVSPSGPPPEPWASALVVEVHADGGIRLTERSGASGLASLAVMRDWIAEAGRAGAPVHLRGAVASSGAAAVVAEVRRLVPSADEQASTPTPWTHGYSSLQTAALNGLTGQVVDLLERGVSPSVGRGRATPYRLAMQHGHAEVVASLVAAGVAPARGLEPR